MIREMARAFLFEWGACICISLGNCWCMCISHLAWSASGCGNETENMHFAGVSTCDKISTSGSASMCGRHAVLWSALCAMQYRSLNDTLTEPVLNPIAASRLTHAEHINRNFQ